MVMHRAGLLFTFFLLLTACTQKEADLPLSTPVPRIPPHTTPVITAVVIETAYPVEQTLVPTLTPTLTPIPVGVVTPVCHPAGMFENHALQGELGPVAIQNGVGYIAVGSQIVVFDPYCTHIVGVSVSSQQSLVGPIVLEDESLYVGSGSLLEVFDLSNPYLPSLAASISLDSEITTMSLGGTPGYLFIGLENGNIGILDTKTWEITYWESGVTGYIVDIESYKNTLLLASSDPIDYSTGGFHWFSIQGDARLNPISSLNLGDVTDIELSDDRIYIIAYDQRSFGYGLFTFEFGQSSDIELSGQYIPPSDVPFTDLVVTERFAYLRGVHCELGFCRSSIEVLDISYPSAIKIAEDRTGVEGQNSYNATGWMIIYNGEAYIVAENAIEVWDISKAGEWQVTRTITLRK